MGEKSEPETINPWQHFVNRMPMLNDFVTPETRIDHANQVCVVRFRQNGADLRLLVSTGPSTINHLISSFMLCLDGQVQCKSQGNLCDREYLLGLFEILEKYFLLPLIDNNSGINGEDRGG